MALKNIDNFGENIALYINGRFPKDTFDLIKKMIRSRGKKIIPIIYKTEEDLLTSKMGITLADNLYIVNAKPLNEKTRKLTDYADATNKQYKIFNDIKEML